MSEDLFANFGELNSNGFDIFPDDAWTVGPQERGDGVSGAKRAREEVCAPQRGCDGEGDADTDERRYGSAGCSGGPAAADSSAKARGGARNKACREKARRERINERFSELAKLCDPDDPKTDKSSILADAIKIMKQLRLENGQLRQLNKFLEERAGQYEKEKSQLIYNQSLFMESSMQASNLHAGGPFQGMLSHLSRSVPGVHHNLALGLNPSTTPPDSTVEGGTAVGVPVCPDTKISGPGTSGIVPSGGWVQPNMLDNSQDHLLRPPAA